PLSSPPLPPPLPYTTLFRSPVSQYDTRGLGIPTFLRIRHGKHLQDLVIGIGPEKQGRTFQLVVAFQIAGGILFQSLEGDVCVEQDRKSTRLNSSHVKTSYAV